jgi:DedD protein
MDSRAKQRLTGAVILVAVFVLFVPELLTGPGKNTPADTPAEEGLRRYTIDLDAQAKPGQAVSGSHEPAVILPPVENAAQPALATPGESAAPETVHPAPESAAVASAEAGNAAAPAPSAANSSSATSTPKPTPAPVARVEPSPATATTPAAPPEKGSFAVQLGSFAARDNADRLVRDMTAKGFAAFVAPIKSNGRELYRVRVGPARDRPQAEALAAQLRRMGQTVSIVPIS